MKILYSVTVKIDLDVEKDWLNWMKNTHIPDVMDTNMFLSYRMYRVLGQDESDGITYSIQYVCQDMKTLHKYTITQGQKLQAEHSSRYKNKYVAFRTMLEILE